MRAYAGGGRRGRDGGGGGLNKLGPKKPKKKRISQFVAYIHTFTHNINFVLLLLLWSMLIIIEQYIYVCVYAYTHKYVHPLPGINTTVVDSPSRIFYFVVYL